MCVSFIAFKTLPNFASQANDASSEPSVRVGLTHTANDASSSCTQAPPSTEVQGYIMLPIEMSNGI